MIQALLLSAMLPVQEANSSKIVAASLFKNGFAVVLRETDLKNGQAIIDDIPQASMGTLWLSASQGVVISEATTTTVTTKSERDVTTLDEILFVNVGKVIVVELGTGGSIDGKLLSASGQIVVIEREGKRHAILKTNVRSVASTGGELVYKQPSQSEKRVLQVKTLGGKDGKIYTIGLERGITWAPAYSIDITNEKSLSLIGKATIINDLADLRGIEARLITGFPNLPFKDSLDPLVGGAARDLDQAMLSGGFGTMRGQGPAMGQNMLRADARGNFDESFDISTLSSVEAEDLFFYRRPNVQLKRGERGYYVLFKADLSYGHVYTWDINDTIVNGSQYQGASDGPGDVWHSLKFKNTSDMPWTTAPATTMKDGEILGQDMMTYTARGTNALLKITKALNVRADQTEEEVSRERAAYKLPGGQTFDLVTLKGTLEVKNRKNEQVTLKITRWVTGEVISAEGNPTITKALKGLRQVNSSAKIEWEVPVEAGKDKKLTFLYKVYVSN